MMKVTFKNLRELFLRLGPSANGIVRDALRKFNLAPVVDNKARSVKELAELLGFDVQETMLPKGMRGRLSQDAFARNGYRIEVQKADSVQKRRFAVLHEIGHWLLHVNKDDPLGDPMFFDRSSDAFYWNMLQEREANAFAAVLLFGDGALSAAQTLRGNDLVVLARHFGVSEDVVAIGLKQFAQIDRS